MNIKSIQLFLSLEIIDALTSLIFCNESVTSVISHVISVSGYIFYLPFRATFHYRI